MLEDKIQQSKKITIGEYTNRKGWMYYRDTIYVPNYAPLKLFILQSHHDAPAAGHSGRKKNFELNSRVFL